MAENVPNGSMQVLGPGNLAFVEGLYEDFVRDPSSVPADWQRYFSELANGELRFPKPRCTPSFKPASIFNPPTGIESRLQPSSAPASAAIQDRIYLLIRLYRVRGHRIAQVDPLGLPQPIPPELKRILRLHRKGHGPSGPKRNLSVRWGADTRHAARAPAKYLLPLHWRAVYAHR